MKYPEALPESRDERPTSLGIVYGDIMRGSTFESLDKIAGFIHKTITIPQVDGSDVIRDLIQGNGWVHGLGSQSETLDYLFKQNPYLQEVYGYNQPRLNLTIKAQ